MKPSHLLPIVFAALAACASVDARRALDRGRVSSEVEARTGFELEATSADEARELLEAELGPDEAVRVALALDPQVRAHLAELDAASAARVQAGLLRNPLLQLSATAFARGTEFEIGVAQPLFELFALDARRDTADARNEALRARTARELVRLVYDVRRAWWEARFEERVLEVVRERSVAEEAANRLARELYAAGNVTEGFAAESDEGAAAARAALADAERRARESRARLAQRMGVPASAASLRISAESEAAALTELSQGDPLRASLEASLDLRELRAEVAARARSAGIADWNVWFDPSSARVAARREDGRDGVGAALSTPLPIFDTGSAARATARFELDAAAERLERLELDVESAAQRIRESYEAHRTRAELERGERLSSSRRAVHAVLQQYNAMQVGVFDVLEARREELEVALDALQSERDARRALLQLQELLAGSLPAEQERSELDSGSSIVTREQR
jgi:cobalt-zinc-cadmium efflux system outer membrane protein